MKLAFQKPGPKSFWQKLIAWKTNSPYCHVELVFNDGICFSASEYDKGTRFKTFDPTKYEWDYIDLAELDGREKEVREAAKALDGLPYDWSEITSFIIARPRDNQNEYICSTAAWIPLKVGADFLSDCVFPFFAPYDLFVAALAWKSGHKSKESI